MPRLGPAQRRQAWKALLDDEKERKFRIGPWDAEIGEVSAVKMGEANALRIPFTVRESGEIVLQDEWVAIGGPPVMVEDAASGERGYRHDVQAAFRAHFLDLVESALTRRQAR